MTRLVLIAFFVFMCVLAMLACTTSKGSYVDQAVQELMDEYVPQEAKPAVPTAMFRGNPQRTGVLADVSDLEVPPYPDDAPLILPQDLEIEWTFETGGPVRSSPAVSEGIVYIGSLDHYLYALDAKSGEAKWKFETGDSIESSPLVYGDTVFIGSNDGKLYAIEKNSGQEEWSFDAGGSVKSSPVVVVGKLGSEVAIVVGSEDKVVKLDADSGKLEWAYWTEGKMSSSPALIAVEDQAEDEVIFYIGTDHNELIALTNDYTGVQTEPDEINLSDDDSVRTVFVYGTGCKVESTPAVYLGTDKSEPRIYVGSDDSYLHCVDGITGEPLYKIDLGGEVKSSPAVSDDIVIVGSDNGSLYGLEYESGGEKWKFETGGAIESSPALYAGIAICGSNDNSLYLVDSRTGQLLSKFETGGDVKSSPTVSKDLVYFGSDDGLVYCLEGTVTVLEIRADIQ